MVTQLSHADAGVTAQENRHLPSTLEPEAFLTLCMSPSMQAEHSSRPPLSYGLADQDRVVSTPISRSPGICNMVHSNVAPVCNTVEQQAANLSSQTLDSRAVGVDAMSISWDEMQAYSFLPAPLVLLVQRILQHSHHCRMLLIALGNIIERGSTNA